MQEQTQFEQFFFNDATTDRLYHLAKRFSKPLFLCMPTLARKFENEGKACILLDHDRRFSNLKSFRYFDLFNPYYVEYKFDAIFADPPFSNITMDKFGRAVEVLNGFQKSDKFFICHMKDRESEIKETFSDFHICCYPTHLGYQSVSLETQRKIFLFGPEAFLKYDLMA